MCLIWYIIWCTIININMRKSILKKLRFFAPDCITQNSIKRRTPIHFLQVLPVSGEKILWYWLFQGVKKQTRYEFMTFLPLCLHPYNINWKESRGSWKENILQSPAHSKCSVNCYELKVAVLGRKAVWNSLGKILYSQMLSCVC